MKCHNCPDLNWTAELLAEVRTIQPDFEVRAECCLVEAKREEQMRSSDLRESLKMRDIEREQVRGDAPRNRAERRLAARKARRA